jgi:hypothetical protein
MCEDNKAVRWIGSELCDAPRFDGTGPVEAFLIHNGEGHPHGTEDSGHGCSGLRDTCMVVGDTSHEYSELGTGGELIKVQFHPIIDFELANRYKGTEDPQEHISFCE